MRVLAPGLRRNVRNRALDDLEKRLLHAFSGNIARDRGVIGLAGDLVDLVDVDDAVLGALNIAGALDQAQENVLDILADVPGLGEGGRVSDRKGNIEQLGKRLRQQGLTAAGWADEQDVALLELHIVVTFQAGGDALVVVVDRHRKDLLGAVLTDNVLVELFIQLARGRHPRQGRLNPGRSRFFFFNDFATKLHALIANVDLAWPGNQASDFFLTLIAERTPVMHPPTSHIAHGSAPEWRLRRRNDRGAPAVPLRTA